MSRCWMLALLPLLTLTTPPLAAQQPEDAQALRAANTAYEDLQILDTLTRLQISPQQARLMAEAAADYAQEAAALRRTLAETDQRAIRDMRLYREALLRAERVPAEQVAALADANRRRLILTSQLEDVYVAAHQQLYGLLTPEQQAQLTAETAPAAAETPATTESQREAVQRRQQIATRVALLLNQARQTADPNRFQAFAPAAVRAAVVEITGLLPDAPEATQLMQYFLQQVSLAYRMRPLEFQQAANTLVAQMTAAAEQTMARAATEPALAPEATLRPVSAEQFARVIRYERTPTLLGEFANRPNQATAREE